MQLARLKYLQFSKVRLVNYKFALFFRLVKHKFALFFRLVIHKFGICLAKSAMTSMLAKSISLTKLCFPDGNSTFLPFETCNQERKQESLSCD